MKTQIDLLSKNSQFRHYIKKQDKTAKKPAKKRAFGNPTIKLYLDRWEKIFEKHGWENRSKTEKQELRHDIIEDIFGEYIKPSMLSTTAWDIVFYALEILEVEGILVWSKEMSVLAKEGGTRRRIIWLIRNVGFDRNSIQISGASQEYINSICCDKFGISDFETLELKQLEQLYWTVCSRATKKSAQGGTIAYNENQDNYVEADEGDPF